MPGDPTYAPLVWDQEGTRFYETGVEKGVLWVWDPTANSNAGGWKDGVAWNGLTNVSEKPSGAEATALYADDIKYLNLLSNEEFAAKIEAYTPNICVLDFQEVSFVDSSGIAVVINALRSMTQIEGKLLLTGILPQPMKVFRASGIDKLVQIREAVS